MAKNQGDAARREIEELRRMYDGGGPNSIKSTHVGVGELSSASSIFDLLNLDCSDVGQDFLTPVIHDLWQEAKAAGISLERFGQMRPAEIHTIFLARRTVARTTFVADQPAMERLKRLIAVKGGRPLEVVNVFGSKVKELRGERSQAVFARRCSISIDNLQKAERKNTATAKTIEKICKWANGNGFKIKPKDLIKNSPQ